MSPTFYTAIVRGYTVPTLNPQFLVEKDTILGKHSLVLVPFWEHSYVLQTLERDVIGVSHVEMGGPFSTCSFARYRIFT